MTFERRVYDTALVCLVAVMKEVPRHGLSLRSAQSRRHQGQTLIFGSSLAGGEVVVLGEQLVGRGWELGSVDHALDLLDDGRGAALAVVGEPGIGKTRLLSELAVRGR